VTNFHYIGCKHYAVSDNSCDVKIRFEGESMQWCHDDERTHSLFIENLAYHACVRWINDKKIDK
jgi:hypothetical protein